MTTVLFAFILGIFVGAFLGMFALALVSVGRRGVEE
jgi:hypothetical protein